MSERIRNALCITVGAATLGCASSPDPATDAAAHPVPCAVLVSGADLTGWREVREGDLQFCVPGEWERKNGRWQGGQGFVQWGPVMVNRGRRPYTAAVPVGGGVPAMIVSPADGGRGRELRETIGGRPATLRLHTSANRFLTTVAFEPDTRAVLEGEATSLDAALQQLDVFRTLRQAGR